MTCNLCRASFLSFAGIGTPQCHSGCRPNQSHCWLSTPGINEKKAYWFTIRGLNDGGSNQSKASRGTSTSNWSSPFGNPRRRVSSENILALWAARWVLRGDGRASMVSSRDTHHTIPSRSHLDTSSVAKKRATYGDDVQSSNRVGKR